MQEWKLLKQQIAAASRKICNKIQSK